MTDSPSISRRVVGLSLFGIIVLSIGLRWWMVSHTVVPSRDCLIFVRIAIHLIDPPVSQFDKSRQLTSAADVLKETDQAPGYPIAILGMSRLIGVDPLTASADQMILAAQLVSAVSGVLLIFPFFGVASRLFGNLAGLIATFWFQVLPVFVEVSSDGLSDGLFLLTAISAIWFTLTLLSRERWYTAFLHGFVAGSLIGAGYLVRPDSLIVGASLGMVLLGTCIARFIRQELSRPILFGGIGLLIGTILLMSPYVRIIGKLTNKPTGQGLMQNLEGEDSKKTYFERDSRLPNVRVPLAAWWDAKANGSESKLVWGLKALVSEFLKGGHYLLPIYGIFGLFINRKRFTESGILLVSIVLGFHLLVLWYMAGRIGYVSQRHTLLSVMLLSLFAGSALPVISGCCAFKCKIGSNACWVIFGLGVIAGTCLPRDFQRLHDDRAGHREAGEWLLQHGNADYPIVDPFGWTEFYSGRTLRGWSTADPHRGAKVYAIIEPNAKSHHSRLPWLEVANNLAAQGSVVFQFPGDVPWEQVKIAVTESPPIK